MGDPHALALYGPIWPDLLLAPSPCLVPEREGICRGRGCEVPAFARTTDYIRGKRRMRTNVGAGAAAAQWAVVVGLGRA